MELIIKLLDDVISLATGGETRKERYAPSVIGLDIRTRLMLKQFKYVPNTEKTQLFRETDEQRLAAIQKDREEVEKHPYIVLPYGVSAICHAISRDVKQDLMAYATDFEYAGGLIKFTVSFLSFGPSTGVTRPSEAAREQANLARMVEQGYLVAEKKRAGHTLVDCEKNRELLQAYCRDKLGVQFIELTSRDGSIQKLTMRMDTQKYQYEERPVPDQQAATGDLTPDALHALIKACEDYKEALGTYRCMSKSGSGNLVLEVIENYQYEIENVSGTHGDIWQEKEKKYEKSRAVNREIHSIHDQMGDAAVREVQSSGRAWYNMLYSKLETLVKPLGLFVEKFSVCIYEQMEVSLIPDCLIGKTKLWDVVLDNGNRAIYIKDTKENIAEINRYMQEVLSSCEVESYEVKIRDGGLRHISGLKLRFNKASDLVSLVEKVDTLDQ